VGDRAVSSPREPRAVVSREGDPTTKMIGPLRYLMRLSETRDLFARRLEFPVTCDAVRESVGETELEAPTGGSERIDQVLDRCDTDEFASPDELYGTLMTFVSDEFIGRKYYDDRGSSPTAPGEEEVQF